jgi:hypothetical protein
MKRARRIAAWVGAATAGLVVIVCGGCKVLGPKWDVLWEREFAADFTYSTILAYDMAMSPDSGVLAVGVTGPEALVIRLDRDGRLLGQRLYGGFHGGAGLSHVRAVAAGGYIAGGTQRSLGWLVRLNENGDTAWTRSYGDSSNSSLLRAVTTTADGGFAAAGLISNRSGEQRLMLVRLNAAGAELWRKEWHDTLEQNPYCMYEQPDGGFLISSTPTTLIRTDAIGDTLWTRLYSFGYRLDLCPEPGGGFYGAGGSSQSSYSPQAIVTARFDADGETLWTRNFREESSQKAYRVATTPDGGCAVFGMMGPYDQDGSKANALVLKYDSDGKLEWDHTLGSDLSWCFSGVAGADGWFTLGIVENPSKPETLTIVRTRP